MKQQVAGMKNEVGELEQQLQRALQEIWNLKMQMSEFKQHIGEGKKALEMGFPFVVAVCVGVLIGMLVTVMWK